MGHRQRPANHLFARANIKLNSKYSQSLTGTYKTGRKLVKILYENNHLVIVSGLDTAVLSSNNKNEFSTKNGDRFLVHLDKAGLTRYFLNVNENDGDFYIFNDSPTEKPGANKPAWKSLTGIYKRYNNRQAETIEVFLRNGYLYTSFGGETKVNEYRPGSFFNTDGE